MIIGTAYLKGEKNFELFFASLKFRFPSLKKVFPYTLKSISFCFLVLCRPCILKEVCFKIYQISNAKISKQKITLLKKCNWFVLLFIVWNHHWKNFLLILREFKVVFPNLVVPWLDFVCIKYMTKGIQKINIIFTCDSPVIVIHWH